ncbi:MAG: carbohydrate kinase [Nitrosomonas halophila]
MPTDLDKPAKDIILFGEALVDVFPDGAVVGGAPFNVARHLQAFGLHPVLITRTGDDRYRDKLIQLMDAFAMSTAGIQCDAHYPTGQVRVEFGENGHSFEILPDQAYDFIDPAAAAKVASSIQPDLVYFGTLAQRHETSRAALREILHHSRPSPRLLDINLREPWYTPQIVRDSLLHADYVKVNEDELAALPVLAGLPAMHDARAIAQRLLEEFQLQAVLVTCGGEGAWLLDRSGAMAHTGGIENVSIKDTVGAGDGFSAVFIFGMLSGWPEALLLKRANQFAATLCGIRGAIPDSSEFYQPFIDAWK